MDLNVVVAMSYVNRLAGSGAKRPSGKVMKPPLPTSDLIGNRQEKLTTGVGLDSRLELATDVGSDVAAIEPGVELN